MVFSGMLYMGMFLPLVLLLYFAAPKPLRNGVLLLSSLFFYFVGEPKNLVLMLLSILVNYLCALLIGWAKGGGRRLFLILGTGFNLGLLIVYKYTDFLLSNLNRFFSLTLPLSGIVMPIGISFFTFQGMSYVIDVYWGRVPAQRNLLYVATYISLFPQLVAGPIVRYETIAKELTDRKETIADAALGLRRFIWGLGKKMLLANPLGELASIVFSMESGDRSTALAWLGAVAYAFQIFFDFSGYSDMAIGLGRVFGFHFLENFDYPYLSRSITEFWRRWHISLSTWFRDYLYIPLGGNRKGLFRQMVNLLMVWGLTGLWHGAQWNFLLWGLYYAALLILEKLFLKDLLDRAPAFIGRVYALALILVGWVIFNGGSLPQIAAYIGQMFCYHPNVQAQGDSALWYLWQYGPELLLAGVFSMPIGPWLSKRLGERPWACALGNTAALLLLVLSLCSIVNTSFNPFIYFRF